MWQSWINLTKCVCVCVNFILILFMLVHSLIPIHADMIDVGNGNADDNGIHSLQLVSFDFIKMKLCC